MENKQVKRRATHQELYGVARGSVTLYGIEEIVSKTREQTGNLFRKFLKEGLNIHDSNAIALADICQ